MPFLGQVDKAMRIFGPIEEIKRWAKISSYDRTLGAGHAFVFAYPYYWAVPSLRSPAFKGWGLELILVVLILILALSILRK